jgi:hypothetical protein
MQQATSIVAENNSTVHINSNGDVACSARKRSAQVVAVDETVKKTSCPILLTLLGSINSALKMWPLKSIINGRVTIQAKNNVGISSFSLHLTCFFTCPT